MTTLFDPQNTQHWLLLALAVVTILLVIALLSRNTDRRSAQALSQLRDSQAQQSQWQLEQLQQLASHQQEQLLKLREFTKSALYDQQSTLLDRQHQQSAQLRQELSQHLNAQREHLSREVTNLSQTTEKRLNYISTQVENRLSKGFTSTQSIFQDVLKRLTRIDEAQKRIDQLSSDVTSLRDVLTDKRSRGAFGEVQLKALVDNVLPPQHVSYQASLSNGKRPDCLIHLPEPSGTIAIDAKFPLESYRALYQDSNQSPAQQQQLRRQLRQDVKKHIKDIASKYILPPETALGAIMFIPAEAIFAELHAYHSELIDEAYHMGVWLTSPATLMAVLTTAKSVIKDDATRRQAHQLREQLYQLNQDFGRFQTRMDNLARHIDQAGKDVAEVQTSARKISNRFSDIESTRAIE